MADHPTVAICGENRAGLAFDRIGCGLPILTCTEVFRCTDCSTPFHRVCAKVHFKQDQGATPDAVNTALAERQRDELLVALRRWHPPGTCAVSRSPEYNGGRKSLGCDTCALLASIETGKEPPR